MNGGYGTRRTLFVVRIAVADVDCRAGAVPDQVDFPTNSKISPEKARGGHFLLTPIGPIVTGDSPVERWCGPRLIPHRDAVAGVPAALAPGACRAMARCQRRGSRGGDPWPSSGPGRCCSGAAFLVRFLVNSATSLRLPAIIRPKSMKLRGVPYEIRTRVTAVKGWYLRPYTFHNVAIIGLRPILLSLRIHSSYAVFHINTWK